MREVVVFLLLFFSISFSIKVQYYKCYDCFCALKVVKTKPWESCFRVEVDGGIAYPNRVCLYKYNETLVLVKLSENRGVIRFTRGNYTYTYKVYSKYCEGEQGFKVEYIAYSLLPAGLLIYSLRRLTENG